MPPVRRSERRRKRKYGLTAAGSLYDEPNEPIPAVSEKTKHETVQINEDQRQSGIEDVSSSNPQQTKSADAFFAHHCAEVFASFASYRETGFLCDTVIVLRDKLLPAHGLLLSAVSPFFCAAIKVLIAAEQKDAVQSVEAASSGSQGMRYIDLRTMDTETVEIALQFIYTAKMIVPAKYMLDATELARLVQGLGALGIPLEKLNGCAVTVEGSQIGDTTPDAECEVNDDVSAEVNQTKDEINEVINVTGGVKDKIKEKIIRNTTKRASKQKTGEDERQKQFCQPTESSLLEHAAVRHRRNMYPISVDRPGMTEERHVRIQGRSWYECTLCLKRVRDRSRLKNHYCCPDGVQQEGGHLCDFCGRAFSSRVGLNIHRWRVHESKSSDSFACTECEVKCSNAHNLRQHMRSYHDKEVMADDTTRPKPVFLCNACGKSFTSKGWFATHEKLHRGGFARGFACQSCDKSFVLKSSLEKHQITHTGIKSYACSVCQRTFAHRNSKVQHERIHSGAKPYQCKLCERRYRQPCGLHMHMLMHNGLFPYACHLCSKKYRARVALTVHLTRVHGMNSDKSLDDFNASSAIVTGENAIENTNYYKDVIHL